MAIIDMNFTKEVKNDSISAIKEIRLALANASIYTIKLFFKLKNILKIFLFNSIFLFLNGCSSTPNVTDDVVNNYPTSYLVDKPGKIIIDAHCPNGQQMIGGGFNIPRFEPNYKHISSDEAGNPVYDNQATDCDKFQGGLILEASYPADLNTWRVIIFNPDPDTNCYNSGLIVYSDCYCADIPSLNLHMNIDSVGPHNTGADAGSSAFNKFTDSCLAPKGMTITSGGFKMDHDPNIDLNSYRRTSGLSNGPIWGSHPYLSFDGYAKGWATDYDWFRQYNNSITTYVLYSAGKPSVNPKDPKGLIFTPVIEAGKVKINYAEKTGTAADYGIAQAICDEGYFSPGGGYHYANFGTGNNPTGTSTDLIPHGPTLYSEAFIESNGKRYAFGGWITEGFGAHQIPGNYQNGKPILETGEFFQVYSLQIKNLPKKIKVIITNPANGYEIPSNDNDKNFSENIEFTAEATDYDGTPITDPNSFQWEITGANSGNGSTYNTKIEYQQGLAQPFDNRLRYNVKVTVTGKQGNKGSANIIIYYVTPIL